MPLNEKARNYNFDLPAHVAFAYRAFNNAAIFALAPALIFLLPLRLAFGALFDLAGLDTSAPKIGIRY